MLRPENQVGFFNDKSNKKERGMRDRNRNYTIMLGLLTLLTLLLCLNSWRIEKSRGFPVDADASFGRIIVHVLFFAQLAVFIARMKVSRWRWWITLVLNVLILLEIPFGTLLGIYGFANSKNMKLADRSELDERNAKGNCA